MPEDILDGLMLHPLLPVTKALGVLVGSGFYHPFPVIRVNPLPKQSGALKLDVNAVTFDVLLVQSGHVNVFMLPRVS